MSKYELLQRFQEVFGKHDVTIQPDESIVLDRTLKDTCTDVSYPAADQLMGCIQMLGG